jgi:hypothetical protein
MHLFKPATHRGGRIPCLLLSSLLILASASVNPARADGVSGAISNGQTVSGTVTGSGHDDYSFSSSQGGTFIVSLGETGNHDQHFVPQLEVIPPGAIAGQSEARPYYTNRQVVKAAAGKWTLRVSRLDSNDTSGGTYTLKLAVAGGAGTALTPDQDKSGSNTRGDMDVYTFAGTSGHTARVTLNPTSGNHFAPEVDVFGPDGALANGMWCAARCSFDVPTTNGTYTVTALKHDDSDVTGTYTLSVSNAN